MVERCCGGDEDRRCPIYVDCVQSGAETAIWNRKIWKHKKWCQKIQKDVVSEINDPSPLTFSVPTTPLFVACANSVVCSFDVMIDTYASSLVTSFVGATLQSIAPQTPDKSNFGVICVFQGSRWPKGHEWIVVCRISQPVDLLYLRQLQKRTTLHEPMPSILPQLSKA